MRCDQIYYCYENTYDKFREPITYQPDSTLHYLH